MKIRYLLDENVSPRITVGLQRIAPSMDVLRVGDSGAPPLETQDPEILRYLELNQRMLVTNDRASMPDHLDTYWAHGGQFWGVLWIRPRTATGLLIQELHFIWQVSEAEEWLVRTEWIPL